MGDDAVLRLLDLVRVKLGAADARLEIGGSPPESKNALWVAINAHRRVVAVFEDEPPEHASATLAALVDSFNETAAPASDGPIALARRTMPSELDAELNGLAMRASAECAVIIDASSPVVWARSHPELLERVNLMAELAKALADGDSHDVLDDPAKWPDRLVAQAAGDQAAARRTVMAALGVVEARALVEREPTSVGSLHRILRLGTFAFMVRSLAGVYLLILAFDGGFSEPKAEGVVQRGSSQLEKLIVKLPPTDPPPKPGRVLSLRRDGSGSGSGNS